jgi:acyl-CoA synthetase (NDP forming)
VQEDYIDKVAEMTNSFDKPIVACDIGETEMAMHTRTRFDKQGIPAYSSPEDAARAMNGLVRYGRYLQKKGCFEEYTKNFLQVKRKKHGVKTPP